MKKNFLFFMIILLIFGTKYLFSELPPHTINLFVRSIDDKKKQPSTKKIIKSMADTDEIIKSILKPGSKLPTNTGVYGTYAGFSTFSDLNGQISFSRKTPENKVYLLVTDSIKPIYVNPLKPKTIYGFIRNPKHKAQYYSLEKKQDPETTITSWYVKEEEIPKDGKISYDTIVLFANPKHVIIPTGMISTIPGENLVLPNVYVTKDIGLTLDALSFLKVRHYFAPVKISYNYEKDSYQQRVGN